MASEASTCPSCGARVTGDVDRCDLCGTRLDNPTPDADMPDAPAPSDASSGASDASEASGSASSDESTGAGDAASARPDGVFCNQCGHKNPTAANFCSQCGSELEDLAGERASGSADVPEGTRPVAASLPEGATPSDADKAPEASAQDVSEDTSDDAAEQQAMGQQLTYVVGGAVLVVATLFFITLWSQSRSWGEQNGAQGGPSPTPGVNQSGGPAQQGERPSIQPGTTPEGTTDLTTLAEQTSGTVPSQLQDQVDSLQAVLNTATGDEQRATQRRLINLYIGAGQGPQAALLQRTIAAETDDTDAWNRMGDLFYTWMQQLQQQQNRRAAFQVAQQAADAYSVVAEREPDNLTARTRMGEAYLLTNNPMQGIQAINGVLEDDSTFVPARFQKGLALLQINRLDRAVEEFEKVKLYAEEGQPYYRQAERAIEIIQEQDGGASGNGQ